MEKYLVKLKKEIGKKEEMEFYRADIRISYESRLDPLLITVVAPTLESVTNFDFVERATKSRIASLNV